LIISTRFAEDELKGIVLLEKEKLATIATTLQKQPTTHKCFKSKMPTHRLRRKIDRTAAIAFCSFHPQP
jgi:hypothetical protein